MALEERPDGSLILRMHVPLAASVFVMLLFFGFGFMFAYGLLFEDASDVKYRGLDLGFSLDPMIWDALFLLGMLAMLGPGMFILLGLLRGSKPYVHIGAKRLEVRDRPMAKDFGIRWDEITRLDRFRIQTLPAIAVRGKGGKKVQLSAHTFKDERDFELLCREIEARKDIAAISASA